MLNHQPETLRAFINSENDLLEFAALAYLITDRQGHIQHANRKALQLLNKHDVIGKPLHHFLVKEQRHSFHKALLNLPEQAQQWEAILQPYRGSPHPVKLTVAPGSGFLRWMIQDQHKPSVERQQVLRATFEQAPIAMAHLDHKGRWLRVNTQLCQLFECTESDLLGRPWEQFIHPVDFARLNVQYQQLLNGTANQITQEIRCMKANGDLCWTQISLAVARNTTGKRWYTIVVLENITSRQEARRLAVEEERQRLARELHDAVNQSLFASTVVAETIPYLTGAEFVASLEEIKTLNRSALAEMRLLLMELRPAQLLKTSLGDSLQHLADALQGRRRVAVEVHIEAQGKLPPEVQMVFYRIAQEAIQNIVKHAYASQVQIILAQTPDQVTLIITDNGRGFEPDLVSGGLGLDSMRERAAAIAAYFSVQSRPQHGTQVQVTWIKAGVG